MRDERRRTGRKRDGGALKICAPPGITLPASPPFAVFFFLFIFLSFPFLSPMPPLPSHYRELPLISLRQPISSFLPRNSSGPSRVVNVSSHSLFVLRFFLSCFFVFPLHTTRFMTRICDGGWLNLNKVSTWMKWRIYPWFSPNPPPTPRLANYFGNRGRDPNIFILHARVSFKVKIVVVV